MRHLGIVVIAATCLVISSCVTPEQRQQRAALRMSNARATCLEAGFHEDSSELANCTMTGFREAQAKDAARQREALEAINRIANPPRVPVTFCNPTANGGVICTTQ